MNTEIAVQIVGVSDNLKLMGNYSGRGMWGSETAGVVGSHDDFMGSICELYKELMDDVITFSDDQSKIDEIFDTANKIQDAVSNIRTDSMGYDTIFY
jgi:hypothetical protein